MKKSLLMTTALVALTCGHNAFAENLPTDATNLTSGSYVVERSDVSVSHSGNINLSGTASLDVKTQAIVKPEAEEVDVSKALEVKGNVSLADDASLSVINSNVADDTEKPFMFVNGKYTQTGGELTLKQENEAEWRSTLNAKEADISGGTIKLDTGEIFVYGNADDGSKFNISGGTFEMNNSNISTYPAMSAAEGNSQKGAAMTVSGGTFKMNESSLGRENSGDLDISGGEFTLENGSAIFHDGETGSINISGGTISLKDSSIVRGGDYQSEDGKPASGDINITGGTINAGGSSAEIASVGNIKIANGAELNIASGTTLFAKAISEDMSQAQKATLNVYDNNTKINLGGKLVANINGDDRGKIHFQNSGANIDGDVEAVSLIFEDSHSLSQAVSGTIGGLDIFEIKKGTMVYDKEINGGASSVVVGEGATLDIGTNALHSGGDKGVDGEGVHFKDNSTLAFTVTDKDTYGKIYANYINISKNGTNLNMTLNGAALAKGETTTLKLFNGEDSDEVEIEGKFANLSKNSRYEFADNGDGTFKVTSVASAADTVADAGGSANNAGTAEAWDSVSASISSPVAASVTEKLAQLSNSTDAAEQKAYVDALTAVAPEVAPMVQKTQTETANQVFGTVGTRLTGGSISTGGEGMASGDSIFKRGAMWVQGLFNKSKLDDTSKAKGFDADSSGIAFGAEKFVTDDTKVGIGYAYTNTDIDGFMRSTDVDTHTAILYGEYKPSNWYVNGIATYGWSDYEESKSVAGVGVKADYDVETFGLQAMTGYDMNVNGLGITPEAGLRYVHIKQDAYKDSADQRVSANDSDILTGVIGAKVSKNFELSNGMNIKPEARIAATYDLFNDDVNSVVTLANGSAYAVDGEALDRFGMEFGAGVTAEVNDNVELSLGYEGKFREDYQDHTGLINAKYKF
ncbi:MAG: autotransporter domain-containing protein [Alphaproteobacteria bacterium]|nr:outer membrane autotransporter barrel domain-containing protein [Azospirillum sp. CAG:239]